MFLKIYLVVMLVGLVWLLYQCVVINDRSKLMDALSDGKYESEKGKYQDNKGHIFYILLSLLIIELLFLPSPIKFF